MVGVPSVRIPVDRYTSPAFFERELHELWPRVWVFAGAIDQVAQPGDWFEHRVGPYSALVVRGDDGALRAFQNTCRHRGSLICEGTGRGLEELRCPFHKWAWNLDGRLREIPSRAQFGVTNDDLPLLPAAVGTWGPFVFVNLDADAEPLAEFLEVLPDETAWARLDEFHCTASVSIPAHCNWKTLIDGFSETYHVQGIHPEMLGMTDDVHGPQTIWGRHGRLIQPYGLSSPRLGRPRPDAEIWDSFVEVMGVRVGADMLRGEPCPPIPEGQTVRDVLAARVVERATAAGLDYSDFSIDQLLNMQQYNLFPNLTVLVFSDMVQVVRSRPGLSHLDAWMDVLAFERRPAERAGLESRTPPFVGELDPSGELPIGLVLNQDVANFARSQRGMHQPGLTHFVVSETEECRIVNMHRNLEAYLGIVPTEVTPL
jgi:phenylpropionate dioxygenase-like ring-hydroxylating dioxygenase large terminal subunit